MTKDEYSSKLINKLIFHGRKFVEYSCFPYGKLSELQCGEKGPGYIYDFQYFVFTKSIKTLESIRKLLKMGKAEDALILLRTSFEGYLSSRFLTTNYNMDLLNDFLFIPQEIFWREIIYDKGKWKSIKDNEIEKHKERKPSELKIGKDEDYYRAFYDYLSKYAHCNFAINMNYLDEDGMYTIDKDDNVYMTKIMVLFVYLRMKVTGTIKFL